MGEPKSGIGNVTTNTGLVAMAMAYSRSRMLSAAARLGVADALGDEVGSVDVQSSARNSAEFDADPAELVSISTKVVSDRNQVTSPGTQAR